LDWYLDCLQNHSFCSEIVVAAAAAAVVAVAVAAAAVDFAGPSIGFGWNLDAVGYAVSLRVAT
jgi:hypothetical protein